MGAPRLVRLVVAVSVMLVAGGCGATPPQAPPRQAAKLDSSLSAISTACGLADQLSAFPPAPPAQLAALEATATRSAAKLASVFHDNPAWIYQGETVRTIVGDSLATLAACRLTQARTALAQQTG
jgi:hypothetical protein